MIQKIGFVLFLIGGAGMDSQDTTIPVIMVLIGLVIILVTAVKEQRAKCKIINYENERKTRKKPCTPPTKVCAQD